MVSGNWVSVVYKFNGECRSGKCGRDPAMTDRERDLTLTGNDLAMTDRGIGG